MLRLLVCPYQEADGSSFCKSFTINRYGTAVGSTSLASCLSCRIADTSTRGGCWLAVCLHLQYKFLSPRQHHSRVPAVPPRPVCNGYAMVVLVVNGSESSDWILIKIGISHYYRLNYCPSCYYYCCLEINLSAVANLPLLLASQQGTACDAGLECISPPCVICSMCLPGKYKSCPGPTNCGCEMQIRMLLPRDLSHATYAVKALQQMGCRMCKC